MSVLCKGWKKRENYFFYLTEVYVSLWFLSNMESFMVRDTIERVVRERVFVSRYIVISG